MTRKSPQTPFRRGWCMFTLRCSVDSKGTRTICFHGFQLIAMLSLHGCTCVADPFIDDWSRQLTATAASKTKLKNSIFCCRRCVYLCVQACGKMVLETEKNAQHFSFEFWVGWADFHSSIDSKKGLFDETSEDTGPHKIILFNIGNIKNMTCVLNSLPWLSFVCRRLSHVPKMNITHMNAVDFSVWYLIQHC